MVSPFLLRVKAGAISFVGIHVFLTSVSLAHDAFAHENDVIVNNDVTASNLNNADKNPPPSIFMASRTMTDFITNLYSGKGVKLLPAPQQQNGKQLQLAKNVVFKASPVISVGQEEVIEIYRAFYMFLPKILSPPKCIQFRHHYRNDDNGDKISCVLEGTYLLHLQYFGLFEDKSLLIVEAHYSQSIDSITDDTHDDNRDQVLEITKLEERWNGNKSLDNFAIALSRRINGKLSSYFTSILVP